MRPVPAGTDEALKPFLDEVRTALVGLQQPGKPQAEFAVLFAALPPPENYKNCRCLVTDMNTLAISTLVATTWTWLRADGSAI